MMRIAFVAASVASLAVAASAKDWPAWRGPAQNGATYAPAPVTAWSPSGENVIWHQDFGGRSTPIVWDGRVFFNASVGEGVGRRERVVCLDADTGKLLWENRFNVFHTDIVENRIGWTAVAVDPETGNVYCHGTGGEMFCWDRDGRLVWKRSMTEEFGRISGYGGRLITPIVDEQRVIVSYLNSGWGPHAKPTHRFVAFDKHNGDVLWWSAPGYAPLDTTYATPAVGLIGGRRMLVAPAADGNVYGLLARTGEKVWEFHLSKRGLNVSAVIDGDYAYVAHSEENHTTTAMGAVLCLDASQAGDITETGVVWRVDGLTVGYCSPALANGRLYVITNNANLMALDAKTGKAYWEYSIGRVGKGSPVVTADGVIYVGEQNGVFHILRDEGDHCTELDVEAFTRTDGRVDEFFGSPAVCNGRVYFSTRYNTYCLGRLGTDDSTTPGPPAANEPRYDADSSGGSLLVVPGEVTLAPGEAAQFDIRVLGPNGRYADPERKRLARELSHWSTAGLRAAIDANGKLSVESASSFSAGTVTAEWDGLKGVARVRIIPKLPIEERFDDLPAGSIPPGWVGTGGGPNKKIQVVELDGRKVLQKIATKQRPSPPFMRLRTYVTNPIAGGYTVACDLMSTLRDAGRRSYQPDMGLINSRYRCVLIGADKKRGKPNKIRIESWAPLPRLRKDVEINWDPDVWYTLKFEVRLRESDQGIEGLTRRDQGIEGLTRRDQGIEGLRDSGKKPREPSHVRAMCRAKFWPRGEAEPAGWTIEIEDPYPNTEGSAGIYCYSTGTTSKSDGPVTYFDNLKVYENE